MENWGEKMKRRLQNRNFWYTAVFLVFFSFAMFFSKNLVRAADAPNIVTYQGKLLVNGSAATTTQAMKFVLYDALSAGTALYTASGTLPTTSTINVSVSNGVFTVNFGDTGTNSLSPTIFRDNANVYLEVTIGGETLSPRKRITSAPFALNSKYLNGLTATATPQGAAYIPVADSSGNFNFSGVTVTNSNLTNVTSTGNTALATTTITSLSISGNSILSGLLSVTGNASFGTVASGTWNGNAISNIYGGTGQNSSGWNGFIKVTGGTWATSSISTSDLSDVSSLALLSGNQNFTGINGFATTTITSLNVTSGTIANLNSSNAILTNATFTNATTTGSFWSQLVTAVTGAFSGLTWTNGTSTGNTTLNVLTTTGITTLATTTLTTLNLNDVNGTNLNFINGSVLYLTSSGTASLTDVSVLGNLSVTGNSSFGTVASGTWNGNAISNVYGGTGQNSAGWNGFIKVTGGAWSTSTIASADLSDSSTLAYLANNQTFAGSNIFNATSSFVGNVGIGTSTPSEKLHLYNGTLLVDGLVNPTFLSNINGGGGYLLGANKVVVSGNFAYVG
ncbi:MAG: hypothetical protein NT034_01745, partial [Candidatus Magasanikbacteria bacterium]|nr:hypothetical protein [Candidatus Magasanikbacteria bacterium]